MKKTKNLLGLNIIPNLSIERENGVASSFLWTTRDHRPVFLNITARKGEYFLHCEIYIHPNDDTPMDKIREISVFLINNMDTELLKVRKYMKTQFHFRKCNVFKMRGKEGEKLEVIEKASRDKPLIICPSTKNWKT